MRAGGRKRGSSPAQGTLSRGLGGVEATRAGRAMQMLRGSEGELARNTYLRLDQRLHSSWAGGTQASPTSADH